jgi:hypothetical protein
MVNRELKNLSVVALLLVLCILGWYALSLINQREDSIIWIGKGLNWDYQIKLIHKPNDQVEFITHGRGEVKPCEVPNYAVEMSEGLIYKGGHGDKIKSFKASFNGIPSFLPSVSEMSPGSESGFEKGKLYGMSQNACFSEDQWKLMKHDTTNTFKVTVAAYPYDLDSKETISLKTAR